MQALDEQKAGELEEADECVRLRRRESSQGPKAPHPFSSTGGMSKLMRFQNSALMPFRT